ncbi:MAG: DUF1559 domain-containing protein [Armatimonadota bacterium]
MIAILAAILFPVFARAREKARQSSCLSNVKQMGLATMMYVQDYDETMPMANSNATVPYTMPDGSTWDSWGPWFALIQPYAKNPHIFICPSGGDTYHGCTSYGANRHIIRVLSWDDTPIKIADIEYPAQTLLYADSSGHADDNYSPNNMWRLAASFHPSLFIPARHNGGANLAYCDGHAKWHRIMENDIYTGDYTFTKPPRDICWYPDGRPLY